MTVSHKLLTKFVFSGMKNNKRTIIPYLIAGTFTVMIYYILTSLAFCPYIYMYTTHKEAFYGAKTIAILLETASNIVTIFATIFIFYANQFVIKGRKKEMALYGVLGMSKSNITFIMAAEGMVNALICVVTGILCGTFLNKIMLLVLYKIIGQKPVNGMIVSAEGLRRTLILFVIIYAICLIYNICSIHGGNPIELLHSDKLGEKEPKTKIVTLIIGVAALAVGYFLALSANSTAEALGVLFISIILVVIATYCLFTAGSIFLLKRLKNNKKFYFKTKNFISVSNLMFRMKHNAAGLASICILSTGVIILLTCGFSLMMLGEKNIDNKYPMDIKVEAKTGDINAEKNLTDKFKEAVSVSDVKAKDIIYRQYKTTMAKESQDGYTYMDINGFADMSSCLDLYLVTLEDYNKYTNSDIKLNKDEVLVYQSEDNIEDGKFNIFGKSYKVSGEVDYNAIYYIIDPSMTLFERKVVVFSDENEVNKLLKNDKYCKEYKKYSIIMGCDTKKKVSENQIKVFSKTMKKAAGKPEISFKDKERTFFYNLYGGTFFVGIFLSVLFLIATVLIIYYKQMSEGFEDQKRFEILSKVGLTEKESKRTIKRQVMILFFLPVAASIIHVIVASKVIRLFLKMVLVVDPFTFTASIAVVCLIFFIVYCVVYKITSSQYYRIIHAK